MGLIITQLTSLPSAKIRNVFSAEVLTVLFPDETSLSSSCLILHLFKWVLIALFPSFSLQKRQVPVDDVLATLAPKFLIIYFLFILHI